jgi:hypothetical protein
VSASAPIAAARAGHQDDLPAGCLDRLHLLGIGGDDRVGVRQIGLRLVVGPGPAGDARFQRVRAGGLHGALDQLQRRGPVDPHAALRGVHGLRQTQPLVPEPVPEGQRRFPVDGGRVSHGFRSASGSEMTCAAAKAVRVSGTSGARGTSGSPVRL